MDQASDLRSMMNGRIIRAQRPAQASRVITVTSGKGGVGKTNFTVNLAIWLAKQKKRVVIIDADFGLANIEVLFNVWPKNSFADVVRGQKGISEVLTDTPYGIKFLSGGTGFKDLANITDAHMAQVLSGFGYLDEISDIILIDTGAGISKTVTTFVKASGECAVVTTPEPTAISDSYTLMKTVHETGGGPEFKLVVNRADNEREGQAVYDRLKGVSEKFLKLTPGYLGCIGNDNDLIKAVKEQMPLMASRPNSHYAKNVAALGRKLIDEAVADTEAAAQKPIEKGIKSFMKRIAKTFSG